MPMQDMNLVVIPKTRELDVNPASPDIALDKLELAQQSHRLVDSLDRQHL